MKRQYAEPQVYSLLHELMASPKRPMPQVRRDFQLLMIRKALYQLENADSPTKQDWQRVCDAVNLMETICSLGLFSDSDGLLADAVKEMAEAAIRRQAGKTLRLTGTGIQAVRGVIDDYSVAMIALSERAIIHAHRVTQRRQNEIHQGKSQPHDVQVVSL